RNCGSCASSTQSHHLPHTGDPLDRELILRIDRENSCRCSRCARHAARHPCLKKQRSKTVPLGLEHPVKMGEYRSSARESQRLENGERHYSVRNQLCTPDSDASIVILPCLN